MSFTLRSILSPSAAEKQVNLFVTSTLDYYSSSLLIRCPNNSLKSLPLVQNAARTGMTGTSKIDHISPMLASLHWLSARSRIEFI